MKVMVTNPVLLQGSVHQPVLQMNAMVVENGIRVEDFFSFTRRRYCPGSLVCENHLLAKLRVFFTQNLGKREQATVNAFGEPLNRVQEDRDGNCRVCRMAATS